MKILKFGGTSVGSAARMHAVADLIAGEGRRLVVLSAMSGTTNALVEIGRHLAAGDVPAAQAAIDALRARYAAVVAELFPADQRAAATTDMARSFDELDVLTTQPYSPVAERLMLAQGELLSTRLFYRYYTAVLGRAAVLLPALEFMRLDADEEPDAAYIKEHLQQLLAQHPAAPLFITQGYICRNARGEVDNLKRGGSDYSASLIGAAADATEIQIWTDIDGLHNNDPRVVEDTFPIRELSFDEAAELAYFGAKILHPSSVLPARQHGIPVRLLNTLQPGAPGTIISATTGPAPIKAVAAKDGLVAIKVKSSRMLLAYGFLRTLFEVFERYRTPIDMITTSEVAVSLTIDDTSHLPDILTELRRFGSVEVDEDQTIVCLVGSRIQEDAGLARRVFGALEDVPLRMISYGGSPNNISLLINTIDKARALRSLNGIFSVKE